MYKSLDQLKDEEVVSIVQSGNIEVFSFLVERYEKKMLHYARKFLFDYDNAEDIVQEVFLKAYINIKSFDTSRRFSPWLYRIAHNEFINVIRKKHKEPLSFFDPDILFPHAISKENADKKINEKELHQLLGKSLKKIEVKYREPLVLYYLEELTYKEISDVLHIPVSTVGIRIKRAKEKMKKILEKKYKYEK